MQVIFKNKFTSILLLAATAASCTTTEDKYQSTEMLERPPTLIATTPTEPQSAIEESTPTKTQPGLGDAVTMTEADPSRLDIKQPFDQAWSSVASALEQLELEITDRNRDEGLYYVTYDPDSYQPEDAGVFDILLLKHDYAEEGYILKLHEQGSATEITAEAANKNTAAAKDEAAPADGAEKLLKTLYKTLRDDLKKED